MSEETQIATRATLPGAVSWQSLKEQCKAALASGFLPSTIKNEAQALTIALKGTEVGMPLMMAFAHINVIQGKPAIDAEGMHYLIRKNCPKARIEIDQLDDKSATITASRPGEKPVTMSFSLEDAKRAELLGKGMWQKYPRNLLFARCMSNIARSVFPDCIGGISYTPEELGAEVDEDGRVLREPKIEEKKKEDGQQTHPRQTPTKKVMEKYEGSTEQQSRLQAKLERDGIPEERWLDIHEKMKGKFTYQIDDVLKELQ